MNSNSSRGTESGGECIYRMSGGGPGEPERIGSVIRDAQGNVLDNGSEANLPILKNKNQRGNHPNTLKFNKNPT